MLILIVLGCSDSPTETEDGGSRILEVERFELPAGETREFPSNYEIIAESGIDIAGDIVVTPDEPGDFKLTCRSGTIRISGSITVTNVEDGSVAAASSRAWVRGKGPESPSGISLDFVIEDPGGLIDISDLEQLGAGSAPFRFPDPIVLHSGEGTILAQSGGDGGSIILRAPGGEIRLPARRDNVFVLGPGAFGQGIVVARDFTSNGPTIELIGGRGGDSGRLVLEANLVVGIPTLEDIEENTITDGIAGDGGAVIWDNLAESPRFPGEPVLDRTYPLDAITLRGGDGGDGAIIGGDGGAAVYWSDRVIHEGRGPTPPATAIGGDGGDVFYSAVPAEFVSGGEGGAYSVLGNRGVDGLTPSATDSPNGTDGGDVHGEGGSGGSVQPDVLFRRGFGGGGAHADGTYLLIIMGLNDTDFDMTDLLFGVVSGSGGDGASRCNGCPGGDAGLSGSVTAIAGNGGSVPSLQGSTEARGGRGGDVWVADAGYGASGGHGDPPGRGACERNVSATPGNGGPGAIPGQDGALVGGDPTTCGDDGMSCGEDKECADDTTGTDEDCWITEGSSFTAVYKREIECEDGSTEEIWIEDGFYQCGFNPSSPDECQWYIVGQHTLINGDRESYEGVWDPFFRNATLVAVNQAMRPFCSDGDFYFPGSAYIQQSMETPCTITTTISFGGCNPWLRGRDNVADWTCCAFGNPSPRPWYTPERGPCPD